MSVTLRPIRCRKCETKFSRRVKQQRICEACKPAWRKSRDVGKRLKSRVIEGITLEARIHEVSAQVTPSEKTLCRILGEARKAVRVPGLETYVSHLLMMAEDIRLNDPWSRSDQLRIFGAVWAC